MSKDDLINELVTQGYLKTPSIIEAFRNIDRANFVLDETKNIAYTNQALTIGEGQTISQPLTVAFMLELLEPKTGEKIMDIGAGSGWQAALLAEITGKKEGTVITIERIPELAEMAKDNIAKYNFISEKTVEVIHADGTEGYEPEAPYDKIIAAAEGKELPKSWKEQLRIGGKIVMPIGNNICLFEKKDNEKWDKKQFFGFAFVPLVSDAD